MRLPTAPLSWEQPLPDRLTRLLEELDDLDHAVDGDDTASAPGRAGLNRPHGRL